MSEQNEGPPLVTCPHCDSVVPEGDFCGHCGAQLVARARARRSSEVDSKRRTHAFAAVPTQPVAHVSIVTTLFPHLPHRQGAPFRIALIASGGLVLLLAALHLFAPATAAAAFALPLLYLIYLYEVEVYESEPWLVIGATMVAGALLGFAATYVAGGSLASKLMNGDVRGAFGLATAIAVIDQVLMLAGPMFLYAFRKGFREPLDGLTFGAASALGFTLASSLTQFWPLLTQPLVASGSTIDWAVRLTRAGLLVMLINACTTAVVAASIWMRRYDRRRSAPWWSTIPAAAAVAFGVQLVRTWMGFVLQDLALEFGVLLVTVVLLLLYVRLVIHDSLLVEGAEHEIGPDSMCQECHRVVPTMAFCPSCGAARAAARKGKARASVVM